MWLVNLGVCFPKALLANYGQKFHLILLVPGVLPSNCTILEKPCINMLLCDATEKMDYGKWILR